MNSFKSTIALVFVALQFCASCSTEVELDTKPSANVWRQAWMTTDEFKSPESAAISRNHRSIFVSNVNGYERNGQGFISRLSLDGLVEELIWLDSLNAPTGLAVEGDTL